VLYSIVAYPVGSHKDVTVQGVAQELMECKGRLTWPKMSTFDMNGLLKEGEELAMEFSL
jgi:hypothetical protein